MIELIKYIILGIIQGVTEVFPISSSGHLTIFSNLFNIDMSNLKVFLMITNLGSFIALFYFFRADVFILLKDFFAFLFKKEKRTNSLVKENFNYSLKLIISVIPVGLVGLFFEDFIPESMLTVGISLLVTGSLLLIMYSLKEAKFKKQINFTNAFVIGLFQTAALLPGVSRSGITTVGGLSQKIEIKQVLKFSFLSYLLISIPVSVKGIYDAYSNPESINILGYFLAFIFSFIATFITIKVLYKYVKVKNLIYFAIYCLLIGSFAIIYFVIA